MFSPEHFGLGETLAVYLDMDVEKLVDFVPLLKVPLGKENAMEKRQIDRRWFVHSLQFDCLP